MAEPTATGIEVSSQNRTIMDRIGDDSSEARVLDAALRKIGKSDGNEPY